MKRIILTTLLLACTLCANAQFGGSRRAPGQPFDLATESWNARWISVPETPANDYGVYYFRKEVELGEVPSKYIVHVTGDSRYKFYVNEQIVSLGPARGDATHWNYETVDLAPYLKQGKNILAAVVFHEGRQNPESNVSVSVGFLLQGVGEAALLQTDRTWICTQDKAYGPISPRVPGYYVSGPGEMVDMNQLIPDWNKPSCNTSTWVAAREGAAGSPKNMIGNSLSNAHALQPSIIPQMELKYERLSSVRMDGGIKISKGFPAEKVDLNIPANTKAELLLDQSHLTNAYFTLIFSKGKDAKINIGYTEALYEPSENQRSSGKGNRNEVEGKNFVGRWDNLISNGSDAQNFTTLAWRTYRYVKLDIETAAEPLVINDIYGTFVGYPFKLNASLDTDNQEIKDIFEIGWRTARLCAIETYMDCPFYEQLQYLGDTRIQALISFYNSGDNRLVKNFLRLSDISRNPEGVTMGRYPTTSPQYITPYALSYVYALHDFMMYSDDTDFVMDLLPGAEQIMNYFSKFQQADGRVLNLPGWNFIDWVYTPGWNFGSPVKGADGCYSIIDLQLLYAYQMMSEMEAFRGNDYHSSVYAAEAEKLKKVIQKTYWSEERGLFADRAEKDNFSQHANALAILCGMTDEATSRAIAEKLVADETLSPASVYFKFYLHQALSEAGLGNDYLKWLDIWRENIKFGLTTWGETSDVAGTRSDCHAWGASPNIEFFRTVLGIDSAAPGFKKVSIRPHLGDIKKIGGSMPHPSGEIKVDYKVNGKKIKAEIKLPAGTEGVFEWQGKSVALKSGNNNITL